MSVFGTDRLVAAAQRTQWFQPILTVHENDGRVATAPTMLKLGEGAA